MALQLAVQLQHQLLQAAVVPTETESVRQCSAAGRQISVKFLQHPGQHPSAQEHCFTLIQHAEIRCQSPLSLQFQQMDILPQKSSTEGIDGLDIRLIDQQQLSLEMAVIGIFRNAGRQFLRNAPPQFRGGGTGIGNDQKIVHTGPLRAQNTTEQAVHQHSRLTAARGGGNQKTSALVIHHSLLAGRQLYAHRCSSSPMVSST